MLAIAGCSWLLFHDGTPRAIVAPLLVGYLSHLAGDLLTPRGAFVKRTARVNPGLCMGCGTCVAVCPSKSADLAGFTEQEIYAEVEALV